MLIFLFKTKEHAPTKVSICSNSLMLLDHGITSLFRQELWSLL